MHCLLPLTSCIKKPKWLLRPFWAGSATKFSWFFPWQ